MSPRGEEKEVPQDASVLLASREREIMSSETVRGTFAKYTYYFCPILNKHTRKVRGTFAKNIYDGSTLPSTNYIDDNKTISHTHTL